MTPISTSKVGHINVAGAGAIIVIGQGNAVITVSNNIKHPAWKEYCCSAASMSENSWSGPCQVLGEQHLFSRAHHPLAVDDINVITDLKARAAGEAFLAPLKEKFGSKVDSSQTFARLGSNL